MPKTCACCGGPIRIRQNNYTQHVEDPYNAPADVLYWHNHCEPP